MWFRVQYRCFSGWLRPYRFWLCCLPVCRRRRARRRRSGTAAPNTQSAERNFAAQSAKPGRVHGAVGAVYAAEFDIERLEALCAARASATGAEQQRPAAQPAERRQADAVAERCRGAGAGEQLRHCDCPLQPGHCQHRRAAGQVRRHGARRFDRVADRHAGRQSGGDSARRARRAAVRAALRRGRAARLRARAASCSRRRIRWARPSIPTIRC